MKAPETIKVSGEQFVRVESEHITVRGLTWDTYVSAEDEEDDRIFERARETGRIVRTR